MMYCLLKKAWLLFALWSFPMAVSAALSEKVKIGGLTYYIYQSPALNYAMVTSPEDGDYSGDIAIPEEVEYEGAVYPVEEIAGYAFSYDPVTSVEIPGTINKIGINAFLDCRDLQEIRVPASVETIGVAVFRGCSALRSVVFEDGDDPLTFESQSDCKALRSFDSTEVVSLYLGRKIVADDDSDPLYGMNYTLEELELGPCYTTIENSDFSFNKLTTVRLPETLKTIGKRAFYGLSSLASVALPPSLKTIEMEAFYGCSSLVSIVLPESLGEIGPRAFQNCRSLTCIVLPPNTR